MMIRGWSALASAALIAGAGCATMGGAASSNEKPSAAVTAQSQAAQQFQAAADAQKKAQDEQGKAEAADKEVEQAQKSLADAQAKASGLHARAEQAQREAQQAAQVAQQAGAEQQQSAAQAQQQEQQRDRQQLEQRQKWTEAQQLSGRLLSADASSVQVRSSDQTVLRLSVNDSTAVTVDGRTATPAQLPAGADVRASYQLVDGKATALRIDATTNAASGTMGNDSGGTSIQHDSSGTGHDQPAPRPLSPPETNPR